VIGDLPTSRGGVVSADLGARARFIPFDVTDGGGVAAVFDELSLQAPLRGVIHTAGRGHPQRILGHDGRPGDAAPFLEVFELNVVGSFNVLRWGAARMAIETPTDGARGALVLTSSVAAFEGQVGQIAYATSKAAVAGMTLCAARDLAQWGIRVCRIGPGIFDTLLLSAMTDELKDALSARIPFPQRLGNAAEYAALATHILENDYLNGETLRLDGALRMPPR
jgi:NAD(P)-dependent dehydrogenase (short-subunit alcohol dehydrogenase family)